MIKASFRSKMSKFPLILTRKIAAAELVAVATAKGYEPLRMKVGEEGVTFSMMLGTLSGIVADTQGITFADIKAGYLKNAALFKQSRVSWCYIRRDCRYGAITIWQRPPGTSI